MSILKVANVHFEATGTNRIDYLGDDKVRITSANGTVLSGATNDALLRITQTGTGDAIRVEDSANPDASPFVVDATGSVLIGTTSARSNFLNASLASAGLQIEGIASTNSSMSIVRDGASSNPPRMFLAKSRGATVGSNGLVQSGDILGSISFEGNDGAEFVEGAKIDSVVDGTAASDSMPSRLEFHTSSAASLIERVRIDSTGNVLIGRTGSTVGLGVKLDVNGSINCSNIFVNGNAVGGGASITVTDQSSVDTLQYLTFTTTTSDTASSLNVATTKLTFNVATGTLSSTIFNSTSDINQKENITLLTDSLDIIDALNGVRFTWKDNGLPSLGVIAQEVEKVLPELVSDEKSVNYNGIIAVLIEAVKELKAEIEVLKSK